MIFSMGGFAAPVFSQKDSEGSGRDPEGDVL